MATSRERWQAVLRGLSLLLHQSLLLGMRSRWSCLGKGLKLMWGVFCSGQGEKPNLCSSGRIASSLKKMSFLLELSILGEFSPAGPSLCVSGQLWFACGGQGPSPGAGDSGGVKMLVVSPPRGLVWLQKSHRAALLLKERGRHLIKTISEIFIQREM